MLHRIAFDMGVIGMLFQASLFRIFQRILTDPVCNLKHFEELQTLAKHIIHKFIEAAQRNSKVFVELFFWSTLRESIEIVEGYGTYSSQNLKKTWTEEQDDELRQLYDQFKDNRDDGMDVVDHIMIHLMDQRKSRRQIIRELVHLDLIGSAKELKKRGAEGKRHYVREWREEDELELRHLFEEHKAALDPVGSIISDMKHPRPKHRVIDKLLEIGVVSDKKQLYKKRASKKQKKDMGNETGLVHVGGGGGSADEREPENYQQEIENHDYDNLPSEESEAVSSSDDDDDGGDDDDDDDAPIYIKRIKRAAKKAYDEGLQSSVEWLRNCLRRMADDKEDDDDDDDEPVPIVPILEEQEDAMENVTFKRLLKKCGVKPPANEQERFWRIPGYMTPADLRSRVQALTQPSDDEVHKANKKTGGRTQILKDLIKQKKRSLGERRKKNIEKRQQRSREQTDVVHSNDDQNGSDQEDKPLDETRQSLGEANQSHDSASQSDNEDGQAHREYGSSAKNPELSEEERSSGGRSSQPISSKRKRAQVQRSLDSDSEYSADEDRLTIVEDDANSDGNLVKGKPKQSSKRIKRQRFLIDSESDSEKENVSNDQKRKHESDKKSAEPQSDSDLSDVGSAMKQKKKRIALASDSSDDEQ